jgi:hypothetical protein
VNAKDQAPPGVTWHPAAGSNLTLADVLQDPPPFRLPKLDAVCVPALAQMDPAAYLRQQFPRYLRALEEVAEQAGQRGDVPIQVKLLLILARLAARWRKAPETSPPNPPEEPDLSGLSDEELCRLLGRPDTKDPTG